MTSDRSFDHSFESKMVDALVLSVSRCPSKDNSQVRGLFRCLKSSREGREDFFWGVLRRVASNSYGISAFDQMYSVIRAHNFVSCRSISHLYVFQLQNKFLRLLSPHKHHFRFQLPVWGAFFLWEAAPDQKRSWLRNHPLRFDHATN